MDEFYVSWVPKKSINTNRVNDLLKICLETGTFSNYGPNVQMLENIIRDKFKVDDSKAVIVVANGSVALHILTSAIDFKKTFKWATQSFTFPPSAQANLSNAQIIDVDENGGINLNDIDESINGFIVTNVFGSIVDIDKYVNYAKKFNKILVFDNASTMYTFYKGKNCINYGTGCAVSFHHTKPFGFGEGGAIIIDKIYENNARKLINFGMNLTDEYYVPEGNNSKMSEISAIYLIQYIEDTFDFIIKKHNDLYLYLKNLIEKYNIKCKFFPSFHDGILTLGCFPLLFENYNDNIRLNLLSNKIFCKKYYHPLKNTMNAMKIYDNILCIPCNKDMDYSHIEKIINIILTT